MRPPFKGDAALIVYLVSPSPAEGMLYEFGGMSFCNAFKIGTAADGSDIVGIVTDDDAGALLKALPEYQADSHEALVALHPAADIRSLDILSQSAHT